MKKFPPYGRVVIDVLSTPERWPRFAGTSADGQHVTLWIATGLGAWEWAKARLGRFIVLVAPDDPEDYRWSFITGHDPVLVIQCGYTEGRFLQSLVVALMKDGIRRVLVMNEHGLTRYTRRVSDHAA